MIAKGSDKLKAYVGSTGVDKMYLGDVLVYGEESLPDYLCFTALEDGTFSYRFGQSLSTSYFTSISYSLDGQTWTDIVNVNNTEVTGTTPTITAGSVVYWKGKGLANNAYDNETAANHGNFSSTGRFNVSGKLASVLFSDFENVVLNRRSVFLGMFRNCTGLVDASALVLPTSLYQSCFRILFYGCTSLTAIPVLPATTLARSCYLGMFNGCTSLRDVPVLPATSVDVLSYAYMFKGTAIETSPVLPAATMAAECYEYMFQNCKSLNYIKMLATDISSTKSLNGWVSSIATSGIFVKHIDATWTTTGNGGVPTDWTVIYYNPATDKYYLSDKTTECDDHGNVV